MPNRDIAEAIVNELLPERGKTIDANILIANFVNILTPMMDRMDKLQALENFGVDNWPGYEDAMQWLDEQRSIG